MVIVSFMVIDYFSFLKALYYQVSIQIMCSAHLNADLLTRKLKLGKLKMTASNVIGITALGGLQAGSPNLTATQVDAHGNLTAWIQDVAEGIVKKENGGTEPDWTAEMKSVGWFKAWIKAVVGYTKFVTITSDQSVQVSKSTHSGNINIGEILNAAMEVYVGGEALATYASLNSILGNPSTAVSDFADFWWSHVEKSTTNTGVKFGPAIPKNGGESVEFTALYFSMTETVDDWRSLFVSSHYESVDIYTIGLTFQYTNEGWKEFGPDIQAKLSPAVKASIKSAPLGG